MGRLQTLHFAVGAFFKPGAALFAAEDLEALAIAATDRDDAAVDDATGHQIAFERSSYRVAMAEGAGRRYDSQPRWMACSMRWQVVAVLQDDR